MRNLLPPSLSCEQCSDKNIWVSEVIPVFKVRPCPEDNYFVGYQLMIFAKKTRKSIVYDAQVNIRYFDRTGNFTCRSSCSESLGCLCAGRIDLKDCCLGNFTELQLLFFEDGKVWATCATAPGEDYKSIYVKIPRGYDSVKRHKDEGFAYNIISLLFRESGESLNAWVRKVNNV